MRKILTAVALAAVTLFGQISSIPGSGMGGSGSGGGRAFGASFVSSDGSTALTAGKTVYFAIPAACTITGWSITADAGTATVDIWKVADGTALPTVSNTITAAATPALASGNNISSTTLTGWDTAVAAKDVIGINLKVVATATYVNLTVGCS